jgi:hypothetical protein
MRDIGHKDSWFCQPPTLFVLAFIFLGQLTGMTECSAETPLGRRTTHQRTDLIDGLLQASLYDDALRIAKRDWETSVPGSAERAAAAIRYATVLVSLQKNQSQDALTGWDGCAEPLRLTLDGYENSPFAPWLVFQQYLIELHRLDWLLIKVLGEPTATEQRETFLQNVQDLANKLQDFEKQIDQWQAEAMSRTDKQPVTANDLLDLQDSVRRTRIALILLPAELFTEDSDDSMAIAAAAELAANRWLAETPATNRHREAVMRQLAEAYRRGKRTKEAIRVIKEWVAAHGTLESATSASLIEALLADGQQEAAQSLLQNYYSDDPSQAPRSLEMDLVRLKWLLESSTENEATAVATWVEAITTRHGAYARRLAESRMLRQVDVDRFPENLTIILAQASQMLRSGDKQSVVAAAELYRRAAQLAKTQGDDSQGFRWGVAAGTALIQVDEIEQGSAWIAEAAIAFPEQPKAADIHLESIRQLAVRLDMILKDAASKGEPAENREAEQMVLLENIERLLLQQIRVWPDAAPSRAAQLWLMQIYEASSRFAESANVGLQLPLDIEEWPSMAERSLRLWLQGMLAIESATEREELALRGATKFREVLERVRALPVSESATSPMVVAANLAAYVNLLIALGARRESIANHIVPFPVEQSVSAEQDFAADLLRVRATGTNPEIVALQIPKLLNATAVGSLAIERLHQDGKENASDRKRLAAGVLRLLEAAGSSEMDGWSEALRVRVAESYVWTGDWQAANKILDSLITKANQPGPWLQQAARILAESSEPQARAAAIDYWNRFAAGVPKGTPVWYEAKLATIALLQASGQSKEAQQMAQYILLTQPPEDAAVKKKFTDAAQPKS